MVSVVAAVNAVSKVARLPRSPPARDGRICYSLNHNLYDLEIDQTEDTVNVEYNDNGEVSVW